MNPCQWFQLYNQFQMQHPKMIFCKLERSLTIPKLKHRTIVNISFHNPCYHSPKEQPEVIRLHHSKVRVFRSKDLTLQLHILLHNDQACHICSNSFATFRHNLLLCDQFSCSCNMFQRCFHNFLPYDLYHHIDSNLH